MKFNKSGQLILVAAASIAVSSLLSACATLTVDFVFVTSAKAAGPNNYGEVDVFEVDSESGHMRQIPTSPFPSGGRNPVAEAVSQDQTTLYVANRDDNTIVQFTIGNDGKVYPQNTINTPGVFPLATAVSGSTLFAADTYQPLPSCSPAAPCSGSIAAFPLNAGTTSSSSASKTGNAPQTGVPVNSCNGLDYLPLAGPGAAAADLITPVAMSALVKGSNLFVVANDTTTGNTGYLYGYVIGSTTCSNATTPTIVTLTPLPGSPWLVGKQLSAVTQDPTGSFVFVTDIASNEVLAYSVTGSGLTPVANSPFVTGNNPSAIVIDAKGKYAYVANSLDSTVTAYSVSGGALTRIASYPTDTQPVAIGIDPSLNQYLYTANFLSDTVSGFELSATDGTLLVSQFSPFAANANPTAIAAVTHGAVAKQ